MVATNPDQEDGLDPATVSGNGLDGGRREGNGQGADDEDRIRSQGVCLARALLSGLGKCWEDHLGTDGRRGCPGDTPERSSGRVRTETRSSI